MECRVPKLTVDAVIIDDSSIVLVKRKNEPFNGFWALPGGFVNYGERVEDSLVREVLEETGLQVEVEQLVGVYSDPQRDPRSHTVTIAYLCNPVEGRLVAGDDAVEAEKFGLSKLPEEIAFDHKRIIDDALEL